MKEGMISAITSICQNCKAKLSRALRVLIATPRRAIVLVPLALIGAYMIGFGATTSLAILGGGFSGKQQVTMQEIPPVLYYRLLSLVPQTYAAAIGPRPCTASPCAALEPESYSNTSDFYTTATGVDFEFRVPGQPNVGYVNVNSPRKTVTQRFD